MSALQSILPGRGNAAGQRDLRRRRGRRRLCRHVHAAPAPWAWIVGPGLTRQGDGVGGTWYWNRYPGARCDVESMQYSYSFSDEIAAGMGLERALRAAAGAVAICQPCCRPLQPAAGTSSLQIRASIGAAFDQATGSMVGDDVEDGNTRDGRLFRAENDRLPVERAESPNRGPRAISRARSTIPAYWPHEPVDFTGLRVGVIGTGSSGDPVGAR